MSDVYLPYPLCKKPVGESSLEPQRIAGTNRRPGYFDGVRAQNDTRNRHPAERTKSPLFEKIAAGRYKHPRNASEAQKRGFLCSQYVHILLTYCSQFVHQLGFYPAIIEDT